MDDLIDIGDLDEPTGAERDELLLDLILALVEKHELTVAGSSRWPPSSRCSTGCAMR